MAHGCPFYKCRDMKNYGFIRVAAAVTQARPAAAGINCKEISEIIDSAHKDGVSLLSFPELSVTGCSCGDLFGHNVLLESAEEQVRNLISLSTGKEMAIIVGVPVQVRGRLYDCAAVIKDGSLKGLVPKIYLSSRERRWFASGSDFLAGASVSYAGARCDISPDLLFEIGEVTFAVEIGDDLRSPIPPSSYHTLSGAQIIINPASDNGILGKGEERNRLLQQHSARTACAYINCSAWGESSQDTVYPGSASIWETGENMASKEGYTGSGYIISDIDIEKINFLRRQSPVFHTVTPDGTTSAYLAGNYIRIQAGNCAETDFSESLARYIEPHPFVPSDGRDTLCKEVLDIQVEALMHRLRKIRSKAVIGISGGLDSTLALLVAVLAFDRLKQEEGDIWNRENIIAVTMPGFGTTSRTKNNAWDLMKALGATCRDISIVPACEQHFQDIGHDPSVHDATYENSQARERTQILMDIANQTGGIVVGTGDLSELALGWATYNGDHMSMYGVNAGVPKTLVRSLVKWAAENRFNQMQSVQPDDRNIMEILLDIVDTPISPELLPADDNGKIQQVTEDLVGPYELHDFFIWNFMRYGYSPEKILFLAKKAFLHPEERSDVKIPYYDEQTIVKWLKTFVRRFFNQQFKRSCMPDGPATGQTSLSPRGGWIMPSDADSTEFSL